MGITPPAYPPRKLLKKFDKTFIKLPKALASVYSLNSVSYNATNTLTYQASGKLFNIFLGKASVFHVRIQVHIIFKGNACV